MTAYCRCSTPAMNPEVDEGCRRCGRPVDFSPKQFCRTCGVPMNEETTAALWDVYDRIRDGRSRREALVYTQDDLQDAGFYDDEEMRDSVMLSMERDMHERGLCVTCGRPDLRGVNEDDVMDEEEARDLHDMWSEMEAERRMGA